MFFLATFGHWIDGSDSAAGRYGPIPEAALYDYVFSLEAPSEEEARKVTEKYEGLEIYAYEGIGKLKSLRMTSEEDAAKKTCLVVFEPYLRGRSPYVRESSKKE